MPISSLPASGLGDSTTRSAPKCARKTAAIACIAPSSTTVIGKVCIDVTAGSLSAPEAIDSACAIRVMEASVFFRTSSLKVRTLMPSSASSGMMLSFAPACT
ncbi:Uncharacterised protein [Mycobacteroides abscessus subsp. abscessus]|nr:Uncharacterised protein [Mycobacteroides abscessus subsp. abscessus]